MRPAIPFLLILAATPVFSGPGVLAPATPLGPFRSAAELEKRLTDTAAKLERLVEKARQDPRMAKVERYLSWSNVADFLNPKRDVHVTDLIEYVADEDAPKELRDLARDALKSTTHRSQDPDVEYAAAKSKRAAFCLARVVPLLGPRAKGASGGDATRAYAAEILDSYWHYTHKAIQLYNPSDKATWQPAIDEWKKHLAGK